LVEFACCSAVQAQLLAYAYAYAYAEAAEVCGCPIGTEDLLAR
jgi:DNA-directed RNA polymerase specialized sigma24 family protein